MHSRLPWSLRLVLDTGGETVVGVLHAGVGRRVQLPVFSESEGVINSAGAGGQSLHAHRQGERLHIDNKVVRVVDEQPPGQAVTVVDM